MPDMSKKENQKPVEGEVPGPAPEPKAVPDPAPTDNQTPAPSDSTQTNQVTVTLEHDDWLELQVSLNESIRFYELVTELQDDTPENQDAIQDTINRKYELLKKIKKSAG